MIRGTGFQPVFHRQDADATRENIAALRRAVY